MSAKDDFEEDQEQVIFDDQMFRLKMQNAGYDPDDICGVVGGSLHGRTAMAHFSGEGGLGAVDITEVTSFPPENPRRCQGETLA